MIDKPVLIAKIRFNTLSDGDHLCWRLLLDNTEYLVNNIEVQVPCFTSKDWLEDKQVYKHHITIKDCRVIIDEEGMATVLPADK